MSRFGVFVLTDRQADDKTDRRTKPVALPLAHARGVKIAIASLIDAPSWNYC
jgi:hypothetical protein